MYKRVIIFVLSVVMMSLSISRPVSAAWPWSGRQDLVTINGIAYTPDDYLHWWENLSEEKQGDISGRGIDSFVEWKLLVQEGENMELDQSPAVQRKNEVYKRFRIRMAFKNEMVDSKIHIGEEDLRARLEEDYNPVSYLTYLYFRSREKAEEVRHLLISGDVSFDQLKKTPEDEGGPHQVRQNQYFPYQLAENSELNKVIESLAVGDVSEVLSMGSLAILMHFDKKEAPDESLYKEERKTVYNRLLKEQSAQLTKELIDSLWKKYEVEINEELFSQAGPDLEGEILQQPITRTNKAHIPMFLLVKDIRNEHSMRKVAEWPAADRERLYRGLLKGMIIEYLITWESHDRHYEETESLKWDYAYQQEKNLINELEQKLLEPRSALSEDEIMQYYRDHEDEFKDADMISLISLDADQGLVGKIWQEISRGADFTETANKFEVNLSAQKDIALEKLAPEFRAVVVGLDKGGISEPFAISMDRYALVKLLDRKVGQLKPVESVKSIIVDKLQPGKFQKIRDEYIKKLINFSEIDVNRPAWDKLVAEQKK